MTLNSGSVSADEETLVEVLPGQIVIFSPVDAVGRITRYNIAERNSAGTTTVDGSTPVRFGPFGEVVRFKLVVTRGVVAFVVREFVDGQDEEGSTGPIFRGFMAYSGSQYTQGSPLTLSADVETNVGLIFNNILSAHRATIDGVDEFYDSANQLITGKQGDSISGHLLFKAVPSANNGYLETWLDIGGSIGELYRDQVQFARGTGVPRPTRYMIDGYTLDTYEANGATVNMVSNIGVDLYDFLLVLRRWKSPTV